MAFPSASISGLSCRHAIVIGLLSLLVPIAAQAKSDSITSIVTTNSTCIPGLGVCIQNVGNGSTVGIATGSASGGLEMDGLNGTSMSTVNLIGTQTGSNLGTLSLTTGALLSGSLGTGGTFANGTMTITANNYNGFSGTLFTGTFGNATSNPLTNNPITWTLDSGKGCHTCLYVLTGSLSGTWEGTTNVTGLSTQIFFTTHNGLYKGGQIDLSNGSTFIITPEISSMGLMGTAMLGMAVVVRRKVKRDSESGAAL